MSGRPVSPLRLRANLYLEGVAPWAEFGWLGKELRIGQARLSVFARTSRCEATNVDPATGARDMAIPAHLLRTWGHRDFGVYAKVVTGGEIGVRTPIPRLRQTTIGNRLAARRLFLAGSGALRPHCGPGVRGGAGIPGCS